tara:strand:- start:39535 stop:39777 length:243 start_codon:yes stop_codon:yes gene_type:complete
MADVNLADAKARFSELVNQAAAGETVRIIKRGKPVAKLTGANAPRRPVDLTALKKLTSTMPRQTQSAGDFIRSMRDEDRY